MDMNFCRRCGTTLEHLDASAYKCENGHEIYLSPNPCAGVFLLRDEKVLLAVRGIEPRKGGLDSFGGFLEPGESIEAGAERELREELSLERVEYGELHYLTSHQGDYPRDGEVRDLVVMFFWARLLTDRELTVSDDVADMVERPLSDITTEDFEGAPDLQIGIPKLQELYKEGCLI